MAERAGVDPERVITNTLRRIGAPHPDFGAKQILADLAGARIILKHQPPAATPCLAHPSIDPPCPLCR